MASHQTYEEGKKLVMYGLKLLAAITVLEVLFALAAKGHLPGIPAFYKSPIGGPIYMLAMVGASLYKAWFIVFNFMHMAFETRGLVLSVLLPCLLLVWAIIAFFQEGHEWGKARQQIQIKDQEHVSPAPAPKKEGFIYVLPTGAFRT